MKRLGFKLILAIIIVNTILAIVASAAQLSVSYIRDRNEALASIETVQVSFKASLENALWEYNFELIEALLEGVYSQGDINYVRLSTNENNFWEKGKNVNELIIEELDLTYSNNEDSKETIGNLKIGVSLLNAVNRIKEQLGILIASNFIKSLISSTLISIIFYFLVTRYINVITKFINTNSWLESSEKINLNVHAITKSVEIDNIISAINSAVDRSQRDFKQLQNQIESRKKTEKKLKTNALQLEKANQEQSEFTYAISHDLRSPANTIQLLLSEFSQTNQETLDENQSNLLALANQTATRMTSQIDDILNYSQTINKTFTPESTNLNNILQEIIVDLKADIVSNEADIVIKNLPSVMGSPLQLRMLFQNLIANAIKFKSPLKAPHILIQEHSSTDTNTATITVSDNGIGIPKEHRQRIFNLFQRLHTQNEYKGSGIGLALCKRIVLNHNGTISIESSELNGSSFKFTLLKDD